MNNLSTIARIRQALASKGVIKGTEVATQGYLRLQYNISTQLSAFTFNVLENQGTASAGEKRLAITDMFTITHWAIYVGRSASSAAGATPTDAQAANMKLYTNNNLNVFTTTGDNLRALYNGQITVTVDRERLIDGYDIQRFWRVGNPNEGLLNYATAPAGGTQPLDYWQGPNYGMAELSPEITLNGVGQNDITVTLPAPTTFIPTGNFTNFAVLIARGIRWQNASKLNA